MTTNTVDGARLPELPEPYGTDVDQAGDEYVWYSADQMRAYARAALTAAGAGGEAVKCPDCDGRGFFDEGDVNDHGEMVNAPEDCPACKGQGTTTPPAPDGDAVACDTCEGNGRVRGEIRCEDDDGSQDCADCDGTGSIGTLTRPAPDMAALVDDAMVERALRAFWKEYNGDGTVMRGRRAGRTFGAIRAALTAALQAPRSEGGVGIVPWAWTTPGMIAITNEMFKARGINRISLRPEHDERFSVPLYIKRESL